VIALGDRGEKGSLILFAASTATVKRIDPDAVLHWDASGFF
jgi:hypothetical protein